MKQACYIAFLACLVSVSTSQTLLLRKLFSTTTSTDPKYFDRQVSGGRDNVNLTFPLSCMATTTQGILSRLKCFDYSTNILATASVDPNYDLVYGLAIKENGKMIVAGITSKIGTFTITTSASSITITLDNEIDISSTNTRPSSAVNEPNTNYFFLGPSSRTPDIRAFHRLDVVGQAISTSSTAITEGNADTYKVEIYMDQFLVATGAYTYIIFADKANLQKTKALDATVKTWCGGVLNNLATGNMYYGKDLFLRSGYITAKADVCDFNITNPSTLTIQGTLSVNFVAADLSNLGMFNYLLMFDSTDSFIYLIRKTGMSYLGRLLAIRTPMIASFAGFSQISEEWFYGANQASESSGVDGGMTTFAILVDNCIGRSTRTLICTNCPSGQYLNETNAAWNVCWLFARIPNGKGFNSATGSISACQNTACTLCRSNYMLCDHPVPCMVGDCTTCTSDTTICQTCATGFARNVDPAQDKKCYAAMSIPDNHGMDPQATGIFKQCMKTACKNCRNNYMQCDDISQNFNDIVYTQAGVYGGSGRVLQWILKLTNLLFKVALMPLDFFLSYLIDQFTAFFSYLKLLDGPFLEYPMTLIHYFSSYEYFGFKISNPHLDWSLNKNCKVEEGLAERGVRCNIFSNYGQNIDILWTALGISALVFIVCFPLKNKDSKVGHYARIIDWNFGWRYFLLFMDGVLLEVFALCLINFSKVKQKTADLDGGFSLSFIVFISYISYYILTAFGIGNWLRHRKTTSADAEQSKPGMGNHKLSLFTFIIRDHKVKQISNLFYFMPVIYGFKRMLLATLAVGLVGKGYWQLGPIVIIETLYTLLLIVGRPKAFIVWNIYDILFSATGTLYIFAKMGSLSDKLSQKEKIDRAGKAMASFLLILALVTTIYILFRLVHATYNAYKGKPSVLTNNAVSQKDYSTVMPLPQPYSTVNTNVTDRPIKNESILGDGSTKIISTHKEEISVEQPQLPK
jgi:hypothetical protein